MSAPLHRAFDPNVMQICRDPRSQQKVDLSSAHFIYKVAAGSPAQKLGLLPGDCLLAFNGQPILTSLTDALLAIQDGSQFGVRYLFYQAQSDAFLEVETDCMPLGLDLLPNSDTIIEAYAAQGYYGNEGFHALWEREDYMGLKEAISAAYRKPTALSFMQRLVRASHTSPALEIFRAICDFEMHEDKERLGGLLSNVRVREFAPDMQALLYFYIARQAQDERDIALYQEYILAAHKFRPMSERIKRGAMAAGFDINGQESMLSWSLPLHYKFTYLCGGAGDINMSTLIAAIPPQKITMLCFMPMCRGSNAYNEALKVFHTIYAYHKDNLHQMLVITNADKQRKDPPSWYEQEEKLIAAGFPISVLLEPTGNFIKDLSLRNAPTLWAVDKTGRIVWDKGLASDYDYWEMLRGSV